MKITTLLSAIIASSLLFSAMSLSEILFWLAWIIFGAAMILLFAYWYEVAQSDEISLTSVLFFALAILIAVVTGGLSL